MNFTERALLLCREMSSCDGRLGQYSDYEGDENGPTFCLWSAGVEEFEAQCRAAIKQHAIAMAIWKKFQKLNRLREIAEQEQLLDIDNVDDLAAAIAATCTSICAAIQRCTNPKNTSYPDYGGRGIIVCEHWRTSYRQFIADMGLRPPGLTLDRKDNSKGYLCPECCPPIGNCEWANRHQQRVNQRPRKRKEKPQNPRGDKLREWWATQPPKARLARTETARALAGDGLGEWRAKKDARCLRCGHEWAKTVKTRSKMCPKCHTSKWDVSPSPTPVKQP